jgi:two-component system nitrogen regulation response regulator NtrX
MSVRILVIDDDEEVRRSLKGLLEDEQYEVLNASNGDEGLQTLHDESVDLVLLDIIMPERDGLDVLSEVKRTVPSYPPVIIISGYGDVETAVKALKAGAYDFVEKPFMGGEKLLVTIENALTMERLRKENEDFKERIERKYEILGKSKSVQRLREDIRRAAPSNGRVIISGENGSGKELVARALHNLSNRSSNPFIEINCAAIPSELMESELFGYEKGAFTGASTSRKGKFELADEGTLFLDEICDMSLPAQAKLLRVLQEGEFRRIGGEKLIQVDVRIIAATNKNVQEEVDKGVLREDLYYRLNVIPISVSPLRERKEDIPLLAQHFLRFFCMENGRAEKRITAEALDLLLLYSWPGNIRELKNLMERLVIMTEENVIPVSVVRKALPISDKLDVREEAVHQSLRKRLQIFERMLIEEELERTKGNISQAARRLGIERPNLYRKLREHKIQRK